MSSSDSGEKSARLERIRSIVNEDYERVATELDPFVILNLEPVSTWEEATAKYERYERFYRAENFQRLGDMDLTRKALDIRRAVGRAIVDVQTYFDTHGQSEISEVSQSTTGVLAVDPNAQALGNIYYRDGLTYLKLGDLDSAAHCFETATDHDPTQGVALAYRAYTKFRKRMNEPEVIEETRRILNQSSRIDPENCDILVLIARFHAKISNFDEAEDAVAKIEQIRPDHPKLSKLKKRLKRR